MTNPFSGYGVVVKGERLVGREDELEAILSRAFRGNGSISLVGMPKVGKTSLVTEAVDRHRRSEGPAPVLWINLSTIANSSRFFAEVLAKLAKVWDSEELARQSETLHAAERDDASYLACRSALEGGDDRGVVLVIDEFDAVRKFPDANIVINQIRELLYRPAEYHLYGVLISRYPLMTLQEKTENSVLAGVCEPLFLRPLKPGGLIALQQRAPEGIKPPEDLWERTGGHPMLAECYMCSHVGGSSAALVDVPAVFLEHYKHLEHILEPEFEQVLQLAVGPRWSIELGTLERMRAYGILVVGADGLPVGWSAHFQCFLERRARDANLWAEWREVEAGLRDLIEDTMRVSLGPTWLDKLAEKKPALATKVEGWKATRVKEANAFGELAEERRLLDYCYPMELWELIAGQWDVFRNRLGRDKNYWSERFSVIAKVRNPEAHNRDVVPSHVRTLALGYCQELRQLLRAPAQ